MIALRVLLRWAGGALLAGIAWVHGRLWLDGYRDIDVIGPLFAVDTVVAALLAVAVVAVPLRLLPVTALAGAALAAGTAAGLLVSTRTPLFGFRESLEAQYAVLSLVLEAAATVVLLALAVLIGRRAGHRAAAPLGTRSRARPTRG